MHKSTGSRTAYFTNKEQTIKLEKKKEEVKHIRATQMLLPNAGKNNHQLCESIS